MELAAIIFGAALLFVLLFFSLHGRGEKNEIDSMSGTEFEDYCAELLTKNGYFVEEMTKTTGDFGADIIISDKAGRIAVQCKRYEGAIGVKAVQEAKTSEQYYRCERSAVLTNSRFTNAAKALAEENGVMLWDRETLFSLVSYAKNGGVVPTSTGNLRLLLLNPSGKEFSITADSGELYVLSEHKPLTMVISANIKHKIRISDDKGGRKLSVSCAAGETLCYAVGRIHGRVKIIKTGRF